MDKPAIAYGTRPDATPEAERSALANVYRFILDCHKKKEAASADRPADEKERSRNDSLASPHYTR